MQNLVQRGSTAFRYRSGTEGHIIEIEVFYTKGTTRRGICVAIRPIELKDHCVTFLIFSGATVFVEPLLRSTPKKLAAAAEFFDAHVLGLALTFKLDKVQAVDLLKALAQRYRDSLMENITPRLTPEGILDTMGIDRPGPRKDAVEALRKFGAVVILSLIAVSAHAQQKPKNVYKVTHLSTSEAIITCQNGVQPTFKPLTKGAVIVSCATPPNENDPIPASK